MSLIQFNKKLIIEEINIHKTSKNHMTRNYVTKSTFKIRIIFVVNNTLDLAIFEKLAIFSVNCPFLIVYIGVLIITISL